MNNAGSLRAGERGALAAILTLSLAAAASAITRQGIEILVWVLIAIVLAVIAVAGLHRRLLAFVDRKGGSTLNGFLAIFLPLGAIVIFLVYAIGVTFALVSGVPLGTDLALLTILAYIIVLGNTLVLILNTVSLLQKPEDR